ncbi:MAG: 50S ribosomal protein L29 [Methermicoccaceae archaeon]
MAILHPDEIRRMTPEEIEEELSNLHAELISLRAQLAAGGALESPGRIKEIRRTIARIMTVGGGKIQ